MNRGKCFKNYFDHYEQVPMHSGDDVPVTRFLCHVSNTRIIAFHRQMFIGDASYKKKDHYGNHTIASNILIMVIPSYVSQFLHLHPMHFISDTSNALNSYGHASWALNLMQKLTDNNLKTLHPYQYCRGM